MIKNADLNYIEVELKDFLGIGFDFDEIDFGGVSSDLRDIKVETLYQPDFLKWLDASYEVAFCTWGNNKEINLSEIKKNRSLTDIRATTLSFLKKRPISAVLESAVFIFSIYGIPRTMTHQIVRHRNHAYNQQSYRVSPAHHADVRIPELTPLSKRKRLEKIFDELRSIYVGMILDDNIPIEQARNILPMGTLTNICMTVSLKDLINYIKARTLDISQDEHTYIVMRILQSMKKNCLPFYENFIASEKLEDMLDQYLGKQPVISNNCTNVFYYGNETDDQKYYRLLDQYEDPDGGVSIEEKEWMDEYIKKLDSDKYYSHSDKYYSHLQHKIQCNKILTDKENDWLKQYANSQD